MSPIEHARQLCRDLAGSEIDVWTLPREAVERAETTGRPLPEVTRDVVSAWWIRRAQQGDDTALNPLLESWLPEVLRWCRWNGARGVDPEDAAHDVLVRAARRLGDLDRPLGFRAWLWAVTWRVLREHARGPWLRRWVFGATADPPDPAQSPHTRLEGIERIEQIREVLHALTLEQRTLLWHAYVDRRTRPEMAELMGLSVGTTNRRMTLARQRFRAEAERRGLAPRGIAALEEGSER